MNDSERDLFECRGATIKEQASTIERKETLLKWTCDNLVKALAEIERLKEDVRRLERTREATKDE